MREIHPDAFTVISTCDGPIKKRRAELVDAVRCGDILMFRA